ncbi:MAG: tRNA (adenosine(37)-N6)-dimethylallyltransferase MiaA [Lentisphaeria bacterium]
MKWKCAVILGPTCCWKSEIALKLAKEKHGEIISCDSMQIYRELSIGTAKPSARELQCCPHHLVDCLSISEPYDVNRFVQAAKECLTHLAVQKKMAVMVGGTGLYARALIYGLSLLPANAMVAQTLQKELDQPGGLTHLQIWLQQTVKNPDAIPPDVLLNSRRLLRACEVVRLIGKPPWECLEKNQIPAPDFVQFCLLPPFDLLKERIRKRTAKMLAAGWVEEALQAEKLGLLHTPTARQALGYREIITFVKKGAPGGIATLQELLANKTIQYARRQMTWFKHQHPGAFLLTINSVEDAEKQIQQILVK